MIKLQLFNSSYFWNKSYFEMVVLKIINYFSQYFKMIGNTDRISELKSRGLSDDSIKSPDISDKSCSSVMLFW